MRSLSIRVVLAFSLALVPMYALAANVTISGTTAFAAIDGGVDDEDHVANGVFTVTGNLTVNGTINCNDDGAGANSACPMQFMVGGNLVLNAGSAIFAENRTKAGNGGDVPSGGSVTLEACNVQINGLVASLGRKNPDQRVTVRSGTTITVDGSQLNGTGSLHLGRIRGDSTAEDASTNRVELFAAKDIV